MIDFRIFSEADFCEYQQWFKDEHIKKSLYSIDSEWLRNVLNDETGIEYAVFSEEKMIAEVGIVLPTIENPFYVISNIAIHPNEYRKGMGSEVLSKLYELHPLKKDQYWMAFVELKNYRAQRFFEKNGWIRYVDKEMIGYEKR